MEEQEEMLEPPKRYRVAVAIGVVVSTCTLAGCAGGYGPTTIARDRFDYVGSISESWN